MPVVVEQGRSRTFASALPWPGWSRSGRDEASALEALLSYADRYAVVARRAGLALPASVSLEVVERVPGDTTTDFGAPSRPAAAESASATPAARRRQVALLEASWAVLADVAAGAPAALRRGPRGGGRDRDEVVRHVEDAERAYARKVGVRHPPYRAPGDVAVMRAELVAALLAGTAEGPWPASYAVRRTAWHVLDHAWEIEDRSG
ncbi:MAG: hypothetical protein GC157_13350 [Frankiales bacterium]|nr:hypothetical protein [Frankiales bacterium]